MALSSKLFDTLVCPQCKGTLAQVENGQGLLCNKCQLKFPVRDGVPIMLTEEAHDMRGGGQPKKNSAPNTPTPVQGNKVVFRVVSGPDQGMQFEVGKRTCRATGRAVGDPNKTSVLNVDVTLSIDSDTKGLILQYIQGQFRRPQEGKAEAGDNQFGSFQRVSDVVFKDQTLSRLHAMIFFDDVGVGVLDLVSKNGTFVNGEEVESRLLKKGDTIELGETKVVFEG